MEPTLAPPTEPPSTNNGTTEAVAGKSNKDLFIILVSFLAPEEMLSFEDAKFEKSS